MKVTFQKPKRGLLYSLLHRSFSICCDFKIFYFECNHLKTIDRKNNYSLNLIDSCNKFFFFLNSLYEPKVIIQHLTKRVFLWSCIFGNYFDSNLKRSFKIYLLINWSRVILKLFFRHLLESKAFSPSKISCLSVVVAMLPIMVRADIILKYDFVNIQTLYILQEKRLRLTTIS